MKNLLIKIKQFLISSWFIWLAIIIGISANFIFGKTIAILTFFSIIGLFYIYIWGRQIYWWITGTGDYEDKNKEE